VTTAKLYADENVPRALVEALAQEKELYAAGAGDYAAVDTAGSHQLLIERIENLLANKTAQFLERHKERAGSERDAT